MSNITILGANISGLFTAIEIKKKYPDIAITIYEQHKYWNKPCGGAFTKAFAAELEKMGVFLGEAL